MLPLHDDNPVRRPAVVTWVIIGACVAIYFLWQPTPLTLDTTAEDVRFNYEYAAIPCELLEGRPLNVLEIDLTLRSQQAQAPQADSDLCGVDEGQPAAFPGKNVYLSVLTSMFLHGSLWHIGGNMLFLWIFGNNIEDVMGKLGYVVFYLIGGVVATLSHMAIEPDSTVPLVGASGAIAAVMGAYLVLFPRARVRTLVFALLIFFVELPAFLVLGAWFVLQFFTDPSESVAWVAHVGGFVFGVGVALLIRTFRSTRTPVGPAGPWSSSRPYRSGW